MLLNLKAINKALSPKTCAPSMTIEEGIEYLVALLPPNPLWHRLVRQACRDHPPLIRKAVSFRNGPHISPTVDVSVATAAEANEVYSFLLQNGKYSAPAWEKNDPRVYSGKVETLWPAWDPILRLIDTSQLKIINVTLPAHVLFPGIVEVKVTTRQGASWVEVSGCGAGNFAVENKTFGPILFKEIISKIPAAYINSRLNACKVKS